MNISEKTKNIVENCRFCWMCRHVCPIGNATGQERNTARARAFAISMAVRGTIEIKEIIDNIYECSLCGACTNNCVTGFDPKIFVQEVKTDCLLNGLIPDYIGRMIETYKTKGNVYGEEIPAFVEKFYREEGADILLIAGQDAIFKSPSSVKNAVCILKKAGISFTMEREADDTGAALWFLTGKTEETRQTALRAAARMSRFRTVIVYDPIDLKFIRHEYREWGIFPQTEIVGFNEYLLRVIAEGKLHIQKGDKEYTPQDHFAYARDLDDTETLRKIICLAGNIKEMLLYGKEADLAGSFLMREYLPEPIKKTAENRWSQALASGCTTLVTENPAEYELLKESCPPDCRVISVEEMILKNLR